MSDISKITVNGTAYAVKDTTARSTVATKQDALTFDSAPTSGSLNPVTSAGIYTSQETQDNAISITANAGQKNLLNIIAASEGGIIFNEDGSITIGSKVPADISITLGTCTLKAGQYIFSAGADLVDGIYLSVKVSSESETLDCRMGRRAITFTVPQDMTLYRVWLHVKAATSSMTFYPMMRHAEIIDDTFVAYAPTNRELYEEIGDIKVEQQAQNSEITTAVNAGAKNLLNVTGASTSTVTVNADGTLLVNGKNASNVSLTLGTVPLKAGQYVLSSGVNLPQGVYLSARVAAGETKYDCTWNVESVEFTVPSDMTMDRVWLYIPSNTTIENLTIKPMIRHVEISDDTFTPYAPTNRELYEMILALQSGTQSSTNSINPVSMSLLKETAELTSDDSNATTEEAEDEDDVNESPQESSVDLEEEEVNDMEENDSLEQDSITENEQEKSDLFNEDTNEDELSLFKDDTPLDI